MALLKNEGTRSMVINLMTLNITYVSLELLKENIWTWRDGINTVKFERKYMNLILMKEICDLMT